MIQEAVDGKGLEAMAMASEGVVAGTEGGGYYGGSKEYLVRKASCLQDLVENSKTWVSSE